MFKQVKLLEIATLKLRCAILNRKLVGEELEVWETGTQWCVVVLINSSTSKMLGCMGLNALSPRDRGITKGWLRHIQLTRVPQAVKQAA